MVDSFEAHALNEAADRLLAIASVPTDARVRVGRAVAEARFGLERVGVARYEALYRALAES
jgi:hypothetical protein